MADDPFATFDTNHEQPTGTAEFALHSNRLIEELTAVALRLNKLQQGLDRADDTPDDAAVAEGEISTTLEHLETVIRETGLAMLSLVGNWSTDGDGAAHRTHRR
ncbi:hypothetical protein [Nocardia pseudobrasiliensis]|nr:hypothetical protein [Nocardia pseudobrasiliensis]